MCVCCALGLMGYPDPTLFLGHFIFFILDSNFMLINACYWVLGRVYEGDNIDRFIKVS